MSHLFRTMFFLKYIRISVVAFAVCVYMFGGGTVFAQQIIGQAQEQTKPGLGAAIKAWLSGDAQTNQWKQTSSIQLPGGGDATIPEVQKMWPNRGGRGQYVTVEGINFGIKEGEVAFGKLGVSVKGDTNFPGECQKTWWQSNYIIVKVPDSLSAGRYKIRVKRADGRVSKEASFQITDASPSPSICGIVPDNGPLGIPLKIYGSNFGKVKGKVVIGSLEAQTPDTWERNIITTVTPVGDFSSGKVKVINASRSISNLVPFSVGQCTNTSCGGGKTCCSDGSCRLKGTCEEKVPLSIYEWTFFTGSLAKIGEACAFNEQCLSSICLNGKCAAGLGEEGNACKTDAQCKKPLVCIQGACRSALAGLGEKCSGNKQCASGNCINGICAEGAKKEGETCKNNKECVSTNCYNGVCGQTKQCLKVENIEPNGPNFKKNSTINVTFNQLIDEQSFKNGFSLEPKVKGTFDFRKIPSGNTAKSQAVFLPSDLLSEKTAYQIKLADTIKSATSDEILGKCSTDVANKKECSGSGDMCKKPDSTCINGATCMGGGSICSGKETVCEGKGDECIHGATCKGEGATCKGEGTICKGLGSDCIDRATCPPVVIDNAPCDKKCDVCRGNASSCFNGAVCFGAKAHCSGEGTVCGGAETVCSNGAICTGASAICNGEKTICTGKYARCTDGALCGTKDFCQEKGSTCDASGAVCINGAQCVGSVSLCSGKGTVCTGAGSKCTDGALCKGAGSLCLKDGTQCTGNGAECRDGAECLGTDSHCNDKSTVCKGDYSKCENDATCSGRKPLYSGSKKTCNGNITTCIAVGSTCTDGGVCKSIESLCSGDQTVCSGNEAQCSDGATCEGAKTFCTGSTTRCKGAESQCANGALCSGIGSVCTGSTTHCSGKDSVCTNGADCTTQDSLISVDKVVGNICRIISCNPDGSCPAGYKKDPLSPIGKCQCLKICTKDTDCAVNEKCDLPAGICRLRCTADKDCPTSYQCKQNMCVPVSNICPASGTCPNGQPCTPGTNSCSPDNICPASGTCPNGQPCTPGTNSCSGKEIIKCNANGSCNFGYEKDPNAPAGQCLCRLIEPACPVGQVKCVNGCFFPNDPKCVPLSCNNNKICDATESCNCADCFDQKDRCDSGLVCRELTKDCRYENCKMESATESGIQCTDGKDNDCDGKRDGADDTNCFDPFKCVPGKVKCANGCFDSSDDPGCIHLKCNNNTICDVTESCECSDCYDQQDSCRNGEVCRELTKDCRIKNCKMESATESGIQCTDAKDNDCDGVTDAFDSDCSGGCKADGSCKEGYKKDPFSGAGECACKRICTKDADCAPNGKCDLLVGICRATCPPNSNCTENERCVENMCVPKDILCPPESNCPSNMKCDVEAKVCRLRCTIDKDCPTGQRCNKQINMCVLIIPCENDKDCPSGQQCIDKICKEKEIITCNADGTCNLGYEKDPNAPAGQCLCRAKEAPVLTYISMLVNKKQTTSDTFDCYSKTSAESCSGDQDTATIGTQHTYELEILDQNRRSYTSANAHIIWSIDSTVPAPIKLSSSTGRKITATNIETNGNAQITSEITEGTKTYVTRLFVSNEIRHDQPGDPKILDDVIVFVDGNKINPDTFSCIGDTCPGDGDTGAKGNQHMYTVVAYAQNNSIFSSEKIDSIVWSVNTASHMQFSTTVGETIFGTNKEISGATLLTATVTPTSGHGVPKSVSVTLINSPTKRCYAGKCEDILPTSRIKSMKIFANNKDIIKDSFGCVGDFCADDAERNKEHPGNQHSYIVKAYDINNVQIPIADADIQWTVSGQREIFTLSKLFSSETFGTNSFAEGAATLTASIRDDKDFKSASIDISNQGPFLICTSESTCTYGPDQPGDSNILDNVIIYADGAPVPLDSFYCVGDTCSFDGDIIKKGNQHEYTVKLFAQNNSEYVSTKVKSIVWKIVGAADVIIIDKTSGPAIEGTNTLKEDTVNLVVNIETKDGQKKSASLLIKNNILMILNTLKAPSDLSIKELYSNKIVLSWKNNAPDAEGVSVERRLYKSNYGELVKLVGKNTYSDVTNIEEKTFYSYQVRAYKGNMWSDYSNYRDAITSPVLISAPQSIQAEKDANGKMEVKVSWQANDEMRDGFEIERQDLWGGNFSLVGRATSTQRIFLDSKVQPLLSYVYRIHAYTNASVSSYVYAPRVTMFASPGPSAFIAKLRLYIEGVLVSNNKDSFKEISRAHIYKVTAYDKNENGINFRKNATATITQGGEFIEIPSSIASGEFTVRAKKISDTLETAVLRVEVEGSNKEKVSLDITITIKAGEPDLVDTGKSEPAKPIITPCTAGTKRWEYDDDSFDFGISYCVSKEDQLTDDPIMITSDPEALRVYFFQFHDPKAEDDPAKSDPNNTDVIVVRVFQPSDTDIADNYYSLSRWYASQNLKGASTPTVVDGYEALKGPVGTYVGSFVAKPDRPTTSAEYYVLHITANANPRPSTILALNKFISNMTLSKSIVRKEELQRDLVRILDLKQMDDLLKAYRATAPCAKDITKPCYPALEGGAYMRHQTISGFPSWNATLGNDLGVALPADPHPDAESRPLGVCKTPYDTQTCWDDGGKEFFYKTKTRVSDVEIALDAPQVHAYSYKFIPRSAGKTDTYRVCARLEFFMTDQGRKLCFPETVSALPSLLASAKDASVRGSIRAEYWRNMSGDAVSVLTASNKYPRDPDYITYLPEFEIPSNDDENYGVRISGYIYPPADGRYSFFVSSTIAAEVSLKDADGSKVTVITTDGSSKNWIGQTSDISGQGNFEKNKPYFIQVLAKAGEGVNNSLKIGWQDTSGIKKLIQGDNLSPYVVKASQCTSPQVDDGTGKCIDCPIGSSFDGVSDCQRCGGLNDTICPNNCTSISNPVQCFKGCRNFLAVRDEKCKECLPGTVSDNVGGCKSCGAKDEDACPVTDASGKWFACTDKTNPKCWNGCKETSMTENKTNKCAICAEWSYYEKGICLPCGGQGQVTCDFLKAVQTRDKCKPYLTEPKGTGKCEYCLAGSVSDEKGGCVSCGEQGEPACPYDIIDSSSVDALNGWSDASTSSCEEWKMIGGYGNFGKDASTQKIISNLSAGNYIVAFDFYKIDSWDHEMGRFYWNGAEKWTKTWNNTDGNSKCGTTYLGEHNDRENYAEDYVHATVQVTQTTDGNATLMFNSTLDEDANNESWGVNNIKVYGTKKYATKAENCTPSTPEKCWDGCKQPLTNVQNTCSECPMTPAWTFWKNGECPICGENGKQACSKDPKCRIWNTEGIGYELGRCVFCPAWTNSYKEGNSCEACGERNTPICMTRPTGVSNRTTSCKDWAYKDTASGSSVCSACGKINEIPCPSVSVSVGCKNPLSKFVIGDVTKCACEKGYTYNNEKNSCDKCGEHNITACNLTFTTKYVCKPLTGLDNANIDNSNPDNKCLCPKWSAWDGAKCAVCGTTYAGGACMSQTEKCQSLFTEKNGSCYCGAERNFNGATCVICGTYKGVQCTTDNPLNPATKCKSNFQAVGSMIGVDGPTCTCLKDTSLNSTKTECTACSSGKNSDPVGGHEQCTVCGRIDSPPCPANFASPGCKTPLASKEVGGVAECACERGYEYKSLANTCEQCGENGKKICKISHTTDYTCKPGIGLQKDDSDNCICGSWSVWDGAQCTQCGDYTENTCPAPSDSCRISKGLEKLTTGKCGCALWNTWNGSSCEICGGNTENTCPAPAVNSCQPQLQKLITGKCGCESGKVWNGSSCETCGGNTEKVCPAPAVSCKPGLKILSGTTCGCATSYKWNGTACIHCGAYQEPICESPATACSSPLVNRSSYCACSENSQYNGTTCDVCGEYNKMVCSYPGATACSSPLVNQWIFGKNDKQYCACQNNTEYVSGSCVNCAPWSHAAPTYNNGSLMCTACGGNNEIACYSYDVNTKCKPGLELYAVHDGSSFTAAKCRCGYNSEYVDGSCKLCSLFSDGRIFNPTTRKCDLCGGYMQKPCMDPSSNLSYGNVCKAISGTPQLYGQSGDKCTCSYYGAYGISGSDQEKGYVFEDNSCKVNIQYHIDGLGSDGFLRGWVFAPNDPSATIEIRLKKSWGYITQNYFVVSPTNPTYGLTVPRQDVNDEYSITGNHGFAINVLNPTNGVRSDLNDEIFEVGFRQYALNNPVLWKTADSSDYPMTDDSEFVSTSITEGSSMIYNVATPVTIIMKNIGTFAWTGSYKLRISSSDYWSWTPTEYSLNPGEKILPGSSKTFNITIKPLYTGSKVLKFIMVTPYPSGDFGQSFQRTVNGTQ